MRANNGLTKANAVDFRPFESIGVRYEWLARDGRFSMRAEGNGEAFSREPIDDAYPDTCRDGIRHTFEVTHAKRSVVDAVKVYNASPMVTPSKDLVRWWKASCAELKRATKEDTKRNRTRNVPSYADRAR